MTLKFFTGVSILILAATIAAWVVSGLKPWSMSVEFDKIDSHGHYTYGVGEGTWQIRWDAGENGPGWWISGDSRALDIRPFYSFFEWRIGWWKIVLLWLVVPLWGYTPWRSIGYEIPTGKIPPYEWLLYKSGTRLVSRWQEIKSILPTHCVAAYLTGAVLVLVIVVQQGIPRDPDSVLWILSLWALAPLTVPLALLDFWLEEPDGFSLFWWEIYLLILFTLYIRRTNRIICSRVFTPSAESPPARP